MSNRHRHKPRRPQVPIVPVSEMDKTGTIKWFRKDRYFGWIRHKDSDVFLHGSVVDKHRIPANYLVEGVQVRFKAEGESSPSRRPNAIGISIIGEEAA